MDFDKVDIDILKKTDNFDKFICRKKEIDDFIHREAWDFQIERLGISYVFRYSSTIIGFVTLSMADLRRDKMKEEDKLEIGRENYPALQISQLAVCKELERQKIGTYLCDFSLAMAYRLSEEVGCRFLVLNSKAEVIEFYRKYGFKLLPNQEKRREPLMFLNIFNRIVAST